MKRPRLFAVCSALLVLLVGDVALAHADNESYAITVTGTVTATADGQPLPGVNVVIKGTGTGTVTDTDGRYSLNVPDENDVLVFSSIGYVTQEVPVNGRSVIDVVLAEDVQTLEEIVVVGYGEVRKRDLTGSISSIGTEQFNKGVQVSVDQMIQGRVPGVQITQISAAPGGGYSIRIRGATSITAGNEPLYVIDGLPGAPLNSLNMGDIESIEVLKDASAAAIYGSRGANGVILITTKQGRAGEMRINYHGSSSFLPA